MTLRRKSQYNDRFEDIGSLQVSYRRLLSSSYATTTRTYKGEKETVLQDKSFKLGFNPTFGRNNRYGLGLFFTYSPDPSFLAKHIIRISNDLNYNFGSFNLSNELRQYENTEVNFLSLGFSYYVNSFLLNPKISLVTTSGSGPTYFMGASYLNSPYTLKVWFASDREEVRDYLLGETHDELWVIAGSQFEYKLLSMGSVSILGEHMATESIYRGHSIALNISWLL